MRRYRLVRTCGLALLGWTLLGSALTRPAWATVYTVTSTGNNTSDPTTLAGAITAANSNPGSTINFNLSPGSTITLSSALPLIEANMTINGAGASGLTISGNHANQVFFVDNGTVTIKNLAIANGAAVGGNGASGAGGGGGALGAGGALFVNSTANVTVQNVSFNGNTATGGAGGNGGAANGGGGGGGLGASGGSGSNGGGGGGGLAGTGGHGSNGGGGGGGISGSGGQGSNGGAGGGGTTAGSNASNAGGSGSSGASGGISGSSSSTNAPAGNGGNGQSPASGGGGGGGLGGSNSGNGFAGNGGAGGNGGTGGGGGGGGLGGSAQSTPILSGAGGSGGNGGLDGGGGGAGSGINGTNQGGAGGDFGGGGGGSTGSFGGGTGGAGGFGGGGGGAGNTGNATGGAAGFGAGAGGNRSTAGNGGSGYGGAVFVRQGGTLTVQDTGVTGSSVTGGTGASSGSTDGSGMYLMTGVNAGLAVTSGSQTVSDGIGGAGGLTKTGAGTLVLSGANDYTGGTTVSAGTLTGTTTSLQGGITNNAAVVFGQSTNGTYAGSMIGSGTLTKTGIGNLTLSGANSYSGGTTVSAGTLTGTTTSLQGSITDNSAVAFNQSSNGTYAGNMIGSGSLTLGGIGNVTLSGTNSYSGGTTVSAGTLTGTTTSLQGGITNNAAVVFGQSTNGTYAGSMIGSGTLTKTGIGNLTLSGANSYSGGTTVSAGTLTGTTTSLQGSITDNSAVAFNQSTNGTYAGNMSGSGSLTKTGTGSLSLTGTDTYTGPTTVSGGRLAVNGSITSNTTIFTGATLGGNGSITGNVSNSGVVGPGNSIGTLTIHGNYTQNADGNFQEQINNAGNTPGVNNDLLVVHGIAQLGGNVEVQPASGTILLNTRYTFLEATSISGTFNSISVDNVANTRAVLGFDSTDYWFTLLPNFAPLATNSNQFAVATYIDNNFSGLQSLITTLDTLSPSQIQNAFDQLSGSIYGSESQTQLQSSTLELSFLTRQIAGGLIDSGANPANEAAVAASDPSGSRFDPNTVVRGQNAFWPMRRPQGNWNTWALGYGLGGNAQASASGAAGFNYSLGGSVVGGDLVDDNRMLGVYAGYVGSRVGSYLAGQSVQGNGGQLGLYLRKDDGFNYYILLGGLGGDGYYSHRQMQFGNINSTAIGNYGGWQSQAYLERGVTMQGARASPQPYAALQYLYVRQNSFTETGAGQLNLNVAGIDANSLRSLIGMRLAGTGWNRNGRIVTPVARALWLHELLSPSTSLNAQFAPIGGSNFAVQGANLGRDWAILGTGLNCNLGCGWQAYANYDAQVNTQQVFHVGSGGVQYTW